MIPKDLEPLFTLAKDISRQPELFATTPEEAQGLLIGIALAIFHQSSEKPMEECLRELNSCIRHVTGDLPRSDNTVSATLSDSCYPIRVRHDSFDTFRSRSQQFIRLVEKQMGRRVYEVKTANEILSEALTTIGRIHTHPQFYGVDDTQPGAAHTLDCIFELAHSFWASIQRRGWELRHVCDAVHEETNCRTLAFAKGFRRHNPNAQEAEVFEFVRQCWAEIDKRLGIDISRGPETE